ncbi:MAG: hypothetical protein ACKPKO_19200, partial [Candidatus Fonsibacter sp.]
GRNLFTGVNGFTCSYCGLTGCDFGLIQRVSRTSFTYRDIGFFAGSRCEITERAKHAIFQMANQDKRGGLLRRAAAQWGKREGSSPSPPLPGGGPEGQRNVGRAMPRLPYNRQAS